MIHARNMPRCLVHWMGRNVGSSPESVITFAQVSRLTILSLQTSLYTLNTKTTEFSLCYLITIVSSQDSPLCIFQESLERCFEHE